MNTKTKTFCVMALWIGGLGAWMATPGCQKEDPYAAERKAAADKANADKVEAEKAAAVNAALQKAEADRAAQARAAAEKAAADKAMADRAAADQAAAVKAAEEKAAADTTAAMKAAEAKAAAEKAAAAEAAAKKEKAETGALPADLLALKAEISGAISQVDLTLAKLEVPAAAKGDLEKPTQTAIESITALDNETKALKKRADDMREKGASFFDTWEKQLAEMSTPEVIAAAQKRKDEIAKKYVEVLTAMQETRAAFDPFWGDIGTIKKTCEAGLTPDSQKTLATEVTGAKEKSATLKTRAEAVSSKLNEIGAIYQKP